MELQKLILAEDVYDALETGKNCTIRKGRRDIKLDKLLFESLDEKRTTVVNVVMTIHCKLQHIPDEFVWNDGFTGHENMLTEMKRFYPDIQMDTECTVIIFE